MSEKQTMAKFDDSDYDAIVFDEIYFANTRMLAKIKQYSDEDRHKIVIATGDTAKLECIDKITNTLDYETSVDMRVDTIFPNGINLVENKRLKTQYP